MRWIHGQVIKFRSYIQRVFGGWVFKVFIQRFLGFFIFLALLNVGKIKLFELVL